MTKNIEANSHRSGSQANQFSFAHRMSRMVQWKNDGEKKPNVKNILLIVTFGHMQIHIECTQIMVSIMSIVSHTSAT